MNIFSGIVQNVKTLVKRFPLSLGFCFLTGITITLYCIFNEVTSYSSVPTEFSASLVWTLAMITVLSIALTLFAERLTQAKSWPVKKLTIASAAVCLVAGVLFFFYCYNRKDNQYFELVYWSLTLCLYFVSGYFVALKLKEKAGAGLIISLTAAFGLWFCVSSALSLIFAAFFKLIVPNDDLFNALCQASWFATAFFVGLPFFLAGSTKQYEEISVPKAYKVIFLYALFPLCAVLIAVLYAYIIKSLCLLKLPSGTFNPFVSSATCGFMVLCLLLKVFDTKATQLLQKYGAFVMAPLVVVQVVAFWIRVNAYGLTTARYTSLLYIIFSIGAISILFISQRRPQLNLDRLLYLIFAGFCLWGCAPKVNLYDVSEASMLRVIENIYKSHGMYTPEKLLTENASTTLDADEKNAIKTAWDKIKIHKDEPAWVVKEPVEKVKEISTASFRDAQSVIAEDHCGLDDEDKCDSESALDNADNTTNNSESALPKMEFSFRKTFGFERKWNYKDNSDTYKDGFTHQSDSSSFNCQGYSTVYGFENSGHQSKDICISYGNDSSINITEELKKHFGGESITDNYYNDITKAASHIELKKDSKKIILNNARVFVQDDGSYKYNLRGWVLEK